MTDLANSNWRDYNFDGSPSSGAYEPEKPKLREWGTWLESSIQAGSLGENWYATKTLLDADLSLDDKTVAVVYNDPSNTNNGFYVKVGAGGTGTWVQIQSFLPGYQFVRASVTGGTVNAIEATTNPRVSYSDSAQLITFISQGTTTVSPATISFDGGPALRIRTSSGDDIPIGGIVQYMPLQGVINTSGTEFWLNNDLPTAALVAAALAARAGAETAESNAAVSASAAAASAAAADGVIDARLSSRVEAETGVSATALITPLTGKNAFDAGRIVGTFCQENQGPLTLFSSGSTVTYPHVSDEGFVFQSVGQSTLELPDLPRVKGRVYKIKSRIRTTVNGSVNNRTYVGFRAFDQLDVDTYIHMAADDVDLDVSSGWQDFEGELICDDLAANIVKLNGRVVINYFGDGTGTQQIQHLTVEWEDSVKVAGSSSLPRTQIARSRDKVDLREFFNVSGSDASASENNAAVDAWIAHATANPGTRYVGRKSDVIRISSINKTLPEDTSLFMNGGKFRWSGDISGSANNVFTFSDGVETDMTLEVVSGSNWRRLLYFSGGVRGAKLNFVKIVPESFGGVFSNSFDAALKTGGNNVNIGTAEVEKCFISYMHRGLGGATFDTNWKCQYLDIKEYGKSGAIIQNVDMRLYGYNIRELGTTGLPSDPGYNALLTAGVSGLIAGGTLADAAEHGYRNGGAASGERQTRDLKIDGMGVDNTGQCGFKFFSGTDGEWFDNITLSNITSRNCRNRSGAGGFNDFNFMLQQLRNSRWSNLSAFNESGNPRAFMYMSQLDNVHGSVFQGLHTGGIAPADGIWCSEFNSDGTGTANSFNSVSIRDFYLFGHTTNGVRYEFPTASIRDQWLEGQIIGGVDGIRMDAAAGRFVQPSVVKAFIRGNSGSKFNVPVTANLITQDATTT